MEQPQTVSTLSIFCIMIFDMQVCLCSWFILIQLIQNLGVYLAQILAAGIVSGLRLSAAFTVCSPEGQLTGISPPLRPHLN